MAAQFGARPGVRVAVTHTGPLRFGLSPRRVDSLRHLRDLSREAEGSGFSALLLSDHVANPVKPFAALGYLAAESGLALGTLVLDASRRNPVDVAQSAATVASVARGGIELGIGAGWLASDSDSVGLTPLPPRVRRGRLEETVSVVRHVWAGDQSRFSGQFFDLQGPFERHLVTLPRIMIGGGGRRILEIAAREADIVGVNPVLRAANQPHESLTQADERWLAKTVEFLAHVKRDRPQPFQLQMMAAAELIGPRRRHLRSALAAQTGVEPSDIDQLPFIFCGDVSEVCDHILHLRERFGFSYFVMRDIKMSAAVVDRLSR